jgi:hypothetical protein
MKFKKLHPLISTRWVCHRGVVVPKTVFLQAQFLKWINVISQRFQTSFLTKGKKVIGKTSLRERGENITVVCAIMCVWVLSVSS